MNREKAEKLLAALLFDELDERSRAELVAYLETDDELRERLVDMRMAAKVVSDTLRHGPEPVLSERRLKRLSRLAARRKGRPTVVVLTRLAGAAGIVVAVLLGALVVPSLHRARSTAKYRSGSADVAAERVLLLDDEAGGRARGWAFGVAEPSSEAAGTRVSAGTGAYVKEALEARPLSGPAVRNVVTGGLGTAVPPESTIGLYTKAAPPARVEEYFEPDGGAAVATDGRVTPGADNVLRGRIVDAAKQPSAAQARPNEVRRMESLYARSDGPAAPPVLTEVGTDERFGAGRTGAGLLSKADSDERDKAEAGQRREERGKGGADFEAGIRRGGRGSSSYRVGAGGYGGYGGGGYGGEWADSPWGRYADRGLPRDGQGKQGEQSADVYNRATKVPGSLGIGRGPTGTGQTGLKTPRPGEPSAPGAEMPSVAHDYAYGYETAKKLEEMQKANSGAERGDKLALDRISGSPKGGSAAPEDLKRKQAEAIEESSRPSLDMRKPVRAPAGPPGQAATAPTDTRALNEQQDRQHKASEKSETKSGKEKASLAGVDEEFITSEAAAAQGGKDGLIRRKQESRVAAGDESFDAAGVVQEPGETATEAEEDMAERIEAPEPAKGQPVAAERESRWRTTAAPNRFEEGGAVTERLGVKDTEDAGQLPAASRFKLVPVNPWVMTERDPLSTFALDVDTASYTLCRRYIRGGFLPPPGAVRMEEFINYFSYNYPQRRGRTFAVYAQAAPSPFGAEGQNLTLLKVAVKARTLGRDQKRPAHLVFVVDSSASMDQPDRLGLVQQALGALVERLSPADRVSLVTFAERAHLALEAVSAREGPRIRQAVDAIQPGGPTNLLAGLKLGYETARRAFDPKRINHVILCSDGVANVGQTEAEAVLDEVGEDRKQGITITCVGVGYGSYNDAFLEALANRGDGSYVFLDSAAQAQGGFVRQLTANIQAVAKDARIQVEFNPERVRRYRLIGYENRDIQDELFRDDTIDAGEVGSGQCSTALYELELAGGGRAEPPADGRLATVFVRYRNARTGRIEEISHPVSTNVIRRLTVEGAPRFYLAACAGRFAEILRGSEHARGADVSELLRLAEKVSIALPLDRDVRELVELIRMSRNLPKAP